VQSDVLRHGHATLLLLQGGHPKVVSERLGHASVQITLDTDRTRSLSCRPRLSSRSTNSFDAAGCRGIPRRGADAEEGEEVRTS